MQKYDSLLSRLGLTEVERTIYLFLLEHPYHIIADIVRKTHYHRPSVYRALSALEVSGLVEKSYLEGKRYFYHATSPDHLKSRLESLIESADRLIPELEAMHQKNAEAPILSIKEGITGIQSIHRDLVESLPVGGIYYRYSSADREHKDRGTYIPDEYFEIQKDKALERSVIISEAREKYRSNNPNRSLAVIPQSFDPFDDNITKLIYGNKVSIIDYTAQIGWTIESERFARYEEKIFRLLFSELKKSRQ